LAYIVQPGDCIMSIASTRGFLWQTLWNANPELKTQRGNPNVIFPGDVIEIPDKVLREEDCATERLHKFVKKGTPARFRLVVEQFNVPLANRRYILEIDGKVFEGTTDDKGLLEVGIDPAARGGRLQMPDDNLECALALGHLDPLDELIGVQQRLQNLGFYFGEADGKDNEDTRAAIADFQASVSLEATGELDDATRAKLFNMQDELHAPAEEDAGPEESFEGPSDAAAPAALEVDPEDDAAEMERLLALHDELVAA